MHHFSLWLFPMLSWRGKEKDKVRPEWEERGWMFLLTKNWIFTSLSLRSWWMFPVPETMQLHLQKHWGELPVLLSPGVRPARRRKDMQRWVRRPGMCGPCLSDSNLAGHVHTFIKAHLHRDHVVIHRKCSPRIRGRRQRELNPKLSKIWGWGNRLKQIIKILFILLYT